MGNGSWFDHVLPWWQKSRSDPEHVLFITYEELTRMPLHTCRRICRFAGLDVTEEQMQRAVKASSFEAMQSNEKVTRARMVGKLRQGVMGAWSKVWTVEQNVRFDAIYKERMEGAGLILDFGTGHEPGHG